MLPVLVLTAGLGSRLDPLTRLVAKAAVPLMGRTLIERILGWLVAQGATDAVLNLHHRPETVSAIVGDGTHLGLRVRYSWEQPILGSAGGPRRALPLLDAETFLIVNGDTLCDFDLGPMIAAHNRSGAEVTLAVVLNPAPDHYNGVVVAGGDHPDRVAGFVPRGSAAGSMHFIGLQIVRQSVFAGLPDGVAMETVSGIYRERLALGWTGLHVWRAPSAGLDVGTPADYLAASLAFVRDGASSAIEPGANVAVDAQLVRSSIWSGARVGDAVSLTDCIVVSGVTVPAGFSAQRSILVSAAVTRPGDPATMRDGLAVFPL